MKIRMLRTPAHTPDAPESERRYEGRVYDVPAKDGAALVARGLAAEVSRPATGADDPPPPPPHRGKPGK